MEWQSRKFDLDGLSWQEIGDIWISELGMNFGQAWSALKKSWKHYRVARRTGWANECEELEHRINHIQHSLGLEETPFSH
jgi:tRNA(His) 5'-end guanylyltransferase